MAAPTFVKASAATTDTGGAWTTGTANDTFSSAATAGNIIILQVVQDGTGTGQVSWNPGAAVENLAGTDSEMDYLGEFPIGSATTGIQHLWIGRKVGNGSTIGGSGANSGTDDVYWRFYEFTGVSTGTTLADVIENGSAGTASNGTPGTSTTVADTGVTTLGADRLALNFVGVSDDMSLDPFTGESGGDWTEAVAEYAEASGSDAALGLQIATIASAGTINGGTDTIASSVGWGVVGFALIPASSFGTHNGASIVPLTLTRVVAGFATKAGASNVPLTLNRVTAGFATKTGAAAVPLSLTTTTAGARVVSGAAATPLAVTISTAGSATKAGASNVPLSLTTTTAGFKSTTGSAAVPLTLSIVTNGVRTRFGSSVVPLVVTIGTAGSTAKSGAASLPLVASVTTAGFATKTGATAVPLVATISTAGFATKSGSTVIPLVLTIGTAGDLQGQHTGAVVVPLVASISTAGFATKAGSLVIPLSAGIVTAGFKNTSSSLSVPLVIGITTSGDIEDEEEGTTPFRTLMGIGL